MPGTSLTLRCGPEGPFRKSCLSTSSHLSVTAPSGHAAPLRFTGTSTASVSLPGTSLSDITSFVRQSFVLCNYLVFSRLSLMLFSRSQSQKGDRENDVDTNMLIVHKLDCI